MNTSLCAICQLAHALLLPGWTTPRSWLLLSATSWVLKCWLSWHGKGFILLEAESRNVCLPDLLEIKEEEKWNILKWCVVKEHVKRRKGLENKLKELICHCTHSTPHYGWWVRHLDFLYGIDNLKQTSLRGRCSEAAWDFIVIMITGVCPKLS